MAYIGREPLGGEVILLNSIESQFNGVLTTFNLTRTVSGVTSAFYPVGSEQLLVSLGGVIQKPDTTGDTGFRIAFNTIIFAVAPVAGTSCFIVAYGNVTDIGAPANNTVSTDKLVNGAVTPAKLSTGGPWWLSNGNVGIGTTNPAYKLSVFGTANRSSDLLGNTIQVRLAETEGGWNTLIGFASNSGTFLGGMLGNGNSQSMADLRLGVGSAPNSVIINSSGNVGIGVTNPLSKLHIEAGKLLLVESGTPTGTYNFGINLHTSSGSQGIQITSGSNYSYFSADANNLYLASNNGTTGIKISVSRTAPDNSLSINSSGNVGIGITTPQNVLDLGSATNNRGISWGGTGANYANIWTEYSTASIHIGQGVRPIGTSTGWVSSTGISSVGRSVIKLNFNTGDIGFHTTTPVTVADGSAVTVDQRMVIAGTGNVGIGTTNPSTRLHLHTTAGWGGNITGSSLIRLESTDTVGPAIAFKNSSGSYWNIYHGSTDSFVGNNNLGFMYTDGVIAGGINNVRVTFTSSGNVGIGTTNPTAKLHLPAGTATQNTAPIKLTSGINLTTPESGAFEYDGTILYFTPSARGILPSSMVYRLNSNFVGSNVNTAQPLFGVGVALNSNTVYAFDLYCLLQKSVGASSHTFGTLFGGTSTLNNINYNVNWTRDATTAASFSLVTFSSFFAYSTSASALTVTSAISSSSQTIVLNIKGTVSVNIGGTFIPQYILSAAPGGAYSTIAGSYFSIWPISAAGANTSIGPWA